MKKGMIGKKIGMTQLFARDGKLIPVTVIQATPNIVVQKKTIDGDGYNAVQVGFEIIEGRKVSKPLAGHFKKVNVSATRFLRELRLDETSGLEIGQNIDVNIFKPGDK